MILRHCSGVEPALFLSHVGEITVIGIVVTSVIDVSAIFLLSYWFRYACLMIIARHAPETTVAPRCGPHGIRSKLRRRAVVNVNQVCEVAAVKGLSFPDVQALLRDSIQVDLDNLC